MPLHRASPMHKATSGRGGATRRHEGTRPDRTGLVSIRVNSWLIFSVSATDYWPRLMGSTPAKVRKSIMRKLSGVPSCVGSVGTQLGWTVR